MAPGNGTPVPEEGLSSSGLLLPEGMFVSPVRIEVCLGRPVGVLGPSRRLGSYAVKLKGVYSVFPGTDSQSFVTAFFW